MFWLKHSPPWKDDDWCWLFPWISVGETNEGSTIFCSSSSGSFYSIILLIFFHRHPKMLLQAISALMLYLWINLYWWYNCCRIYLFLTMKQLVIWLVGLVQIVSKCLGLLEMILIWFYAMLYRLLLIKLSIPLVCLQYENLTLVLCLCRVQVPWSIC